MHVLQTPQRSPDLSVMDYDIWKEINRRMRTQEKTWKNNRGSRAEYVDRLRKTALRLPSSFIASIIGDMTRKCLKLYEAKGWYVEEGGRRGC